MDAEQWPDPEVRTLRRVTAVACPHCHAGPREPCVRADGQPLRLTSAHPSRYEAAGEPAPLPDKRVIREARSGILDGRKGYRYTGDPTVEETGNDRDAGAS